MEGCPVCRPGLCICIPRHGASASQRRLCQLELHGAAAGRPPTTRPQTNTGPSPGGGPAHRSSTHHPPSERRVRPTRSHPTLPERTHPPTSHTRTHRHTHTRTHVQPGRATQRAQPGSVATASTLRAIPTQPTHGRHAYRYNTRPTTHSLYEDMKQVASQSGTASARLG